MNKQPFYHRAVLLFTATRDISREELLKILKKELKNKIPDVIHNSLDIDECDSEPGDPSDLM